MRKRALLAAIGALGLITGISTPAHAEATEPQPTMCTQALADAGECLTFVALGNQDPLEAAVEQAVARGDSEQAETYLESQGSDLDVLGVASARGTFTGEAQEADAQAAAASGGYIGTVAGPLLTFADSATYGNCFEGCEILGAVWIEFRYMLDGAFMTSLSGDLETIMGPSVAFNKIECLTYQEMWPWDQVAYDWPNCHDAQLSGFYASYRQVFGNTWANGQRGTAYHPHFNIAFRPNLPGAPEFSFGFRARTYDINSSGSNASWRS